MRCVIGVAASDLHVIHSAVINRCVAIGSGNIDSYSSTSFLNGINSPGTDSQICKTGRPTACDH